MDGTIHRIQNLASIMWVIYSPLGQVITSGGTCLGPTTNNVVEYSIMIELIRAAIFAWYPVSGISPRFPIGSVAVEW